MKNLVLFSFGLQCFVSVVPAFAAAHRSRFHAQRSGRGKKSLRQKPVRFKEQKGGKHRRRVNEDAIGALFFQMLDTMDSGQQKSANVLYEQGRFRELHNFLKEILLQRGQLEIEEKVEGARKPAKVPVAQQSLKREVPFKTVVVNVPEQDPKASDCGAHAARNGLAIFKWVQQMGKREKLVIKGPLTCPVAGSHPGEVYNLARGVYQVPEKIFSVLPNIVSQPGVAQDLLPEEHQINLAIALSALKESSIATHIFIVGEMNRAKKFKDYFGHWVAIVVHKEDDTITYYIADSLRQGRQKRVKSFVEKLHRLIAKN